MTWVEFFKGHDFIYSTKETEEVHCFKHDQIHTELCSIWSWKPWIFCRVKAGIVQLNPASSLMRSCSVKVALRLRGLAWNFPSVSPVVYGKISSHSHELLWVSDSKINLLVWFLLPWLSHSEKFWHQWLIPNAVFFFFLVLWLDLTI